MMVEPAVSALVYTLVRQAVPEEARRERFLENEVVHFVLAQMGRMPDHLRLGIVALTWLFDQSARLTTLRAFHALSPEVRSLRVAAWRRSPLGPLRQLIRFYESLAVYGWYGLRDGELGP